MASDYILRPAHSQTSATPNRRAAVRTARKASRTRGDTRAALREALRASEERHLALAQATGAITWTARPNGLVEDIPLWRAFTGQTSEEVSGRGWLHAIHPDDRECVASVWSRALAKKAPYTTEYRLRRADGVYRDVLARAVPVFAEHGEVREWAGFCIDVSEDIGERKRIEEERDALRADLAERRKHERRTGAALQALLDMAEAVVSTEIVEEADVASVPSAVGQQLVALTRSVLDCTRVGIVTIDETGLRHPVAVAGLSPEAERQWWAEQENAPVGEASDPEFAARFLAGEAQVVDMTKPPLSELPNPYDVRAALVAPLRIGERLIGALSLDYGAVPHEYTEQEIALGGAVAKLASLALERQRLLGERAAAQASALALRDAKERMDIFLSIAGHELRTPITSLKATIQLAERQVNAMATPEAIAGHDHADLASRLASLLHQLERADRQSDRLDRLVGDLVDVSRIQAGKLELRRERTDLGAVVCESVEEQRLLHPDRAITCQTPTGEVSVVVDPDRIGQVVTNYLTNALKYSSADRPVDVHVSVEGGHARVDVVDQGPGLPAEELERIWDRFHRVASITQRSAGVGLGLGLYISRGIIERHGGAVGVASEMGRGSTFSFVLPLAGRSAAGCA